MSQAFPSKTAAEHLGIDHRADPWLSWQVNHAVLTFGRWVDNRLLETHEVEDDSPRRDKPTKRVPTHDLESALGLTPDAEAPPTPEEAEEARRLLSGEIDFNDWIGA